MNARVASISHYNIPSSIQEASLLSFGVNTFHTWKWKNRIRMAQITVEITQWLRAPTSSLSQDTPHYSNLKCFHSKKTKTKNYSYISNVDP